MRTPPTGRPGKKVAYIDEIQYIPVPEESVRADGVGTGEYHYGDSLAPDSYARVKGVPNVEADIGKPYYWAVAHMNKKEGLFTNAEAATGRPRSHLRSIRSRRRRSACRSSTGSIPAIAAPETPWFTDEGKELFNHPDPEKAKALLKEANYDGTPIRWMSTKEYFYNYNAGVVFKQQLEAVGFKVDLQVMDWATLVKRRSDSKEYDVFVTAHDVLRASDPSAVRRRHLARLVDAAGQERGRREDHGRDRREEAVGPHQASSRGSSTTMSRV